MARRATVTLELESEEARADLQQLQSDLEDVEVQAREAGTGFSGISESAAQELAAVRAQTERTAQSMRQMGGSASTTANDLGFELVQAAQDAQFGMAGVANQIPLIAEQFTRLKSSAGGTTGALSALGSSIVGPAGIIGAITLGLPLIQQLTSELFSSSDAADEAASSAASADEAFQGLFETTQQLTQGLPNLAEAGSEVANRFDDLRAPGLTNFGGLAPGGGIASQLDRILGGRGVPSAVRNIQEGLEGSSEEAQILRDALRAAGVDVETVLGDNIQAARTEIEQSVDVFRQLGEDPVQLIEDPAVAADALERQFQEVSSRLDTLLANNLIGEEEAVQKRVDFLRKRLRQAAIEFDGITDTESFAGLLDTFGELGGRLESLESTQSDAADETERQADAAQDFLDIVQRVREAQQQLTYLGRVLGLERGQTVEGVEGAGELERPGQVLANEERDRRSKIRTLTEDMRLAGSARELGGAMRQVGQATEDVKNAQEGTNQQIAQSIRLAGNLGETLIQAAKGADREFNEVLGTIIQTVGSIVGQGNPAAGAGISVIGQIIGGFQHGGTVDTPLQIVGEAGPELAALPQGTQITSNSDTEKMLQDAASQGGGGAQVAARLDQVSQQLANLNLSADASGLHLTTEEAQAELERTGARMYPAP